MSMWYEKYGRDQDVVLSSKAFIVRNVKGYNFTKKMSEGDFGSLTEQVDAAVDKSVTGKLWSAGALGSGTENDDSLLTPESQLFGKNMYIIKNPDHKRIYYNDDAGLSIVLGSTEHITIRAMASGNDPSVYAKAESIAVGLEKKGCCIRSRFPRSQRATVHSRPLGRESSITTGISIRLQSRENSAIHVYTYLQA